MKRYWIYEIDYFLVGLKFYILCFSILVWHIHTKLIYNYVGGHPKNLRIIIKQLYYSSRGKFFQRIYFLI